jgi:hypothetical protein
MEPLDTGEVTAPLDWTAERHAGLDGARLYEFKGGEWTRLTDDFVSPGS